MGPARRAEDLAQQSGRAPAVKPGSGSSGPAISVGPSAAAHCQPARTTIVARGLARRLTSLAAVPRVVKPTTGAAGHRVVEHPGVYHRATGSCPAARSVDTTQRP